MKQDNQKKLGIRIRNAREKANMTQLGLYEKSGISTTQISAFENGKRNIGLQTLSKISTALGVSMDELYFGPQSSKPINVANNKGELIVNCFTALFDEGVIGVMPSVENEDYVFHGAPTIHQIGFVNYETLLEDFAKKLKDFQDHKDDYPDPDSFKSQLLAAITKRINDALESSASKQSPLSHPIGK